jgi:NAD(P)H-dependent flavin oxidoreductase YrpB (nitropropane dioxygenase family)
MDHRPQLRSAQAANVMPTAFTKLVRWVPVQLAAIGGGVTTPELAVAVSQADGLVMLQRNDSRSPDPALVQVFGT